MHESVTLVDVTARDGLQDAAGFVPTAAKQNLLQGIRRAGFRQAEATSFVHPRWVPMLPDAEAVMRYVATLSHVEWIALVPNRRGWERALAVGGMQAITVVCSASELHNQANLNHSREDTLAEVEAVIVAAHVHGLRIRGAISTAFDCPFAGEVPVADVLWVVERYLAMGVDVLSVADTLGTAHPQAIRQKVAAINAVRDKVPLSLHLHDRQGWALANVTMALELGLRQFESALGGLGGCPYAPGAAGNLDAERLVPFLEAQGFVTGIDLQALAEVRQTILETVAKGLTASPSRGLEAGT